MKFDSWTRIAIGQMMLEHIHIKYGTQEEAAKAYGCSKIFIWKVVNGVRMPTNEMLLDADIMIIPIKSHQLRRVL